MVNELIGAVEALKKMGASQVGVRRGQVSIEASFDRPIGSQAVGFALDAHEGYDDDWDAGDPFTTRKKEKK